MRRETSRPARDEQAGLKKTNAAPRKKRRAGEAPRAVELPTELAIGSDGLIYVNAEDANPEMLGGRKMFHGYALTPEEAEIAVREIHRMACNVTIAVRVETNRRSRAKR